MPIKIICRVPRVQLKHCKTGRTQYHHQIDVTNSPGFLRDVMAAMLVNR